MSALYNEIEPYAARWLVNLSDAGHIASGPVLTRSIKELTPDDVRHATQAHFFAGIGAWSYALRLAGWPDDAPVWTGSCPCQPFSDAGKRGGTDDERHLWPEWFRLIRECRPQFIFGEQVASQGGYAWLDAVHADLEGAGYTVGAAVLPAAGVGAPHGRHRLFFVAHANAGGWTLLGKPGVPNDEWAAHGHHADGCGAHGVANTTCARLEGFGLGGRARSRREGGAAQRGGQDGCVADSDARGRGEQGCALERYRPAFGGGREAGELDNPQGKRREWRSGARRETGGWPEYTSGRHAPPSDWSNAAWIPCRDGKARPVEPGTFPLAHGAPARVGRLRAYGNAIVPEAAAEFIGAFIDVMGDDFRRTLRPR